MIGRREFTTLVGGAAMATTASGPCLAALPPPLARDYTRSPSR
jgi:hypothetical protein